jgi:hypothetical protein
MLLPLSILDLTLEPPELDPSETTVVPVPLRFRSAHDGAVGARPNGFE